MELIFSWSFFLHRTEVCCGIIFKGPNGEVMVDTSLLRPCRKCKTPPVAAACASSATLPQAAEATSALTPQALEGSSAPGSPMEAESAATIAPSATDNSILMASASPTPSSAMVTAAQLRVPTPTSLAISTAVSAVLDLSMPVTRPQTTVIMNSSSNVPSNSTVRKNSAAPINLTHQHRCIEMEVWSKWFYRQFFLPWLRMMTDDDEDEDDDEDVGGDDESIVVV